MAYRKLIGSQRGATPRPSRAVTREEKQVGEVTRVPPRSQTSADPTNAGGGPISDGPIRPASEPAMDRISESTFDAPVEYTPRQLGNRRVSPRAGEALKPFSTLGFGEGPHDSQPTSKSTELVGQNSHGVQSDPNAGDGNLSEPGTRIITSFGIPVVSSQGP